MAKFIVVKEAPEQLEKGDYLIGAPSFLEQIALHRAKKPRNGLTGPHYLRMIVDSIGQAYDPENMTAYSIKAHNYEGLPFSTDEDVNAILVKALLVDYPAVFPKYLDSKIRNRPKGTERIFYVNSDIKGQYELFYKNGLDEERIEPVKKSNRVVGKPAITKEEAEKLNLEKDSTIK